MINAMNTPIHADDKRNTSIGPRLGAYWRGLVATGYLALGVWLSRSGRWHTADAFWQDGAWGLPAAWLRSLTLMLVIAWLAYGLAWPVRAARPWLWVGLGGMQLVLLALIGRGEVALALSVLHLSLFDPRWLPRASPAKPVNVFYDGHCGLCHRGVRRLAQADREGVLFTFAPLSGRTFERLLSRAERDTLPDSLVLRTAAGMLLIKSSAVLHAMRLLGGWYGLGALAMGLVPRPVRDLIYDAIARVRHRFFATPDQACPMVPPAMRGRFED